MSNFISELRTPKIYAYRDSRFPNCLKIGFTQRNVEDRIKEQYLVKLHEQSYEIVFNQPAIRDDGSSFRDYDLHAVLQKRGVERLEGEWFKCDLNDVKSAYLEVKTRQAV